MMMTCNTRVTTLSVNMRCAENKYGMWMVAQALLLTKKPTSYYHLPATANSGKYCSTLSQKLTNSKQCSNSPLEIHICWRLNSLQPSLVADSSPHHESLLMVNCQWPKTQDTRQHRATYTCTPLRNDEFTNIICVGPSSISCVATHLYR